MPTDPHGHRPRRRSDTPPELKREPTRGFWYALWGGRMFTFGSHESEARRRFYDADSDHPGALHRWMAHQTAISRRRDARPTVTPPLILELVTAFLDDYAAGGRDEAERYHRKHLTRFLTVLGAMRADLIDEAALVAFRSDLVRLKLSPKTIAHDLGAVKTMWRWACLRHPKESVPRLELSLVKAPVQDAPTPHPVSRDVLLGMIARATSDDALLGECLRMQYLCLMRPTEVVRVLRGEGRFEPLTVPPHVTGAGAGNVVERGLLVLASKVRHRTGLPRVIPLSERALLSVERVQGLASARRELRRSGKRAPLWVRLDSFSSAVRSSTGHAPHVVRDTAASDLHALGVAWADIDLLLGHVPSTAGRSYIRLAWHTLRAAASQLTA